MVAARAVIVTRQLCHGPRNVVPFLPMDDALAVKTAVKWIRLAETFRCTNPANSEDARVIAMWIESSEKLRRILEAQGVRPPARVIPIRKF